MPQPEQRPSVVRIARRSFVMAAVVCCGAISDDADQPEVQSLHNDILEWLTLLDLWTEVEPDEERILRATPGTLKEADVIQAVWYSEGLAIFAWALNRMELPSHDEQVDPPIVADAVLFLSDEANEAISTAHLRHPSEIEAYSELLYAIHSRLRNFNRNKSRKNFSNWIAAAWIDTLSLDVSHLIVDSDLAISGKPIGDATVNDRQECASITYERHKAIIWLLDGYTSYSQVSVDT